MTSNGRTYRFGDANRPGLLLGLDGRQAGSMIAGVLWLAVCLQLPLPWFAGLAGPTLGGFVAFGRWRGTPVAEILVPGLGLLARSATGRARWHQIPNSDNDEPLPPALAGLELLDTTFADVTGPVAVVRDRRAGTVTAVVRVQGRGFPLAGDAEQDLLLARWGAALSPFARERSPVVRVTWQEWAHPVGAQGHCDFLDTVDIHSRATEPEVADYLALVDQQAPVTVAHEVLLSVTVDQRRVRRRRGSRHLDAALDALGDELRLFGTRLDAAGLRATPPLSPLELSAAVRTRSDPTRTRQVDGLARSLAAAARTAPIAWGPTRLAEDLDHVRVDAALHRGYRVLGWPQLPVRGDWLAPLLGDARSTRTVTVVLEPVPMARAARAADREVMAREADAELKERKGFRVNARERKRLADVEARERELAEGHAEFHFVGLLDVTATDLDDLDDACADLEQSAAQALLDLRPLDARHDKAWVASLPLGRTLAGNAR